MNPFQSLELYEEFVYTLQQNFASISLSTLVVIILKFSTSPQLTLTINIFLQT